MTGNNNTGTKQGMSEGQGQISCLEMKNVGKEQLGNGLKEKMSFLFKDLMYRHMQLELLFLKRNLIRVKTACKKN